MPAQASAFQHLANYGGVFGLQDVTSETRLKKHRDEKDGQAMTRYQQVYQSVPVIGGELIINQTAQRKLASITGKISPKVQLNTSPSVSAASAKAIALQAMTKWYSKASAEFVMTEPTLSVYDSRLITLQKSPVALVWQLEVKTAKSLPIKEYILVDAARGSIPLHFNQMAHAKNRQTYNANHTDPDTGTRILVCNESNPSCTVIGITDAVKAHQYAGNTYDYYASVLGRDSINNAGMDLVSVVMACPTGELCPYDNAYWDGAKMTYGDGFTAAEDVVAHELTHGVTENESGLFYVNQSGAINESLSDVFGEFVQQSNLSEPVASISRWELGENLTGIGPFRSMSNPTKYGDPDRMTSPNFYAGSGDNGGVHVNSGVNNKAAYLMVDGGAFNGRTISAIGMTKTAKIYYLAQTNLLFSSSDYLDLYNALNQACQSLIGTAGINSSDCVSVQNATLAVEMNVSAAGASADFCPAGQSKGATLFNDGLETGTFNWLFEHASGSSNWVRSTAYPASGQYSLWGADPSAASDLSASIAAGISLPNNAHLWFFHNFDFEPGYDGGVLEYSTNAGATWADAGSLFAEGKNYTGIVKVTSGTSLAGRSVFTGSSGDYLANRYNLTPLAGQNVRFRWRVVSDASVGYAGWVVDDVQIYSCAIPPGSPTNVAAQSFPGRVQVSFTPPAYSGGTLTGYTVNCSASGQTTRTATGTGSPISVYNLTAGVAYSCSVTASNGLVSGTASAAVSVTAARNVDLTPIMMLLLD
jgi:Zn-dependent metalloprotease